MTVVPPDKQELVDTQGYLQVDDFGYTLSHKHTSHGLKEKCTESVQEMCLN